LSVGGCVEEAIARLELELFEALKAREVLAARRPERVYMQLGGLIVEVSGEEALELLDLRIAELQKAIRRLRESRGGGS